MNVVVRSRTHLDESDRLLYLKQCMLSKHLYVIITKLLYLQAQILFPAPDNPTGKMQRLFTSIIQLMFDAILERDYLVQNSLKFIFVR